MADSIAERVVARWRQAAEGDPPEGEKKPELVPTREMDRHTPFKSLYDLDRYLSYGGPGQREGWRHKGKDKYSGDVYTKRFGALWFEINVDTSGYSHSFVVKPSVMPKAPVDMLKQREEYDAWRKDAWDKLYTRLDAKGLTMAKIEEKIAELTQVYKSLSAPRRKVDTSNWEYERDPNHEADEWSRQRVKGPEAVAHWKKEVERILQDEIDGAGKHGHDWDTAGLVGNVINNYSRELVGPSRDYQSRMIRALLEAMAKAGKIDKIGWYQGLSRGEIRWRSKHYVPLKTY